MDCEIDTEKAAIWLAAQGFPVSDLRCSELGGGVSNRVILAEGTGFRAVLKQSLGMLRVEQEWFSDRARILREAAAMRWLGGREHSGRVPQVLAEDPAGFTIAMEAAPASATMWKTRLFAGEMDCGTARGAGAMLGSIISASWSNPEARDLFGDQAVFEELRIEPYYRVTAGRNPDFKGYFDDLIVRSQARRVSLVHGDFSPKNLLVDGEEGWAIDWEAVHYGDPSFDSAFLLNHLLLKSIAMPDRAEALAGLASEFMGALAVALPPEADWMESAALEHLPALLLARVDGKSPVEYLDEAGRARARQLAVSMMSKPVGSVSEVFER